MYEMLLIPLLKSFAGGSASQIGSKLTGSIIDKLKMRFEPNILEKIEGAYLKASERQLELDEDAEQAIHNIGQNEYYAQLIYGFNLIDGESLSQDHKNINKLFLMELFKDDTLKHLLFNEKLDNIKQDTILIRKNIDDLKEKFISNLSNWPNDKFISNQDFGELPAYHISRKITLQKDWFSHYEISTYQEIINYHKNKLGDKERPLRVLIIADGGIGKSVYLKYLAKNCSETTSLYPIFVSLRDLKPHEIINDYIVRRYSELGKIQLQELSRLVLFLDGFDEIGDSSAGIKQMNDLSLTYPDTGIILTSRKNSFFDSFPDFTTDCIFTLLDITESDIAKFMQQKYFSHNIDVNHFFKEVADNTFQNLLYNPFYLEVLVDCYISNNHSLIISKNELIDNLISKRWEKDKMKRPDLELEKPTTKRKVVKLGQAFAFLQALMDQRNLSGDQIADLFDSDFDLAINALPIRKGYQHDNNVDWEFEHNIFMEHLVSNVLKGLSFEQILEYASSSDKIKSKWRDIICHLLGVLDKNDGQEKKLFDQIIEWLISHDSDLLLNVEEAQLSKDLRSKIFLEIYRWHQERTIWLDSNRIDIKQLAIFGESKGNVLLVLDDIVQTGNHNRQRINASLVFRHFNFNDFIEDKNRILDTYLECIFNMPHNPTTEDLMSLLISDIPFCDKDSINRIVLHFKNTESSRIISGLVDLITKNNLCDKYIGNLIVFYECTQKSNDTSFFDAKSSINASLRNLKESTSYIQLFKFLANKDYAEDLIGYEKDTFKEILINSLKHYNAELLISVINICLKHVVWNPQNQWEAYEYFFSKESIRVDALRWSLSELSVTTVNDSHQYVCICFLSLIIREEDLSEIFESIHQKEFYIILCRLINQTSAIYKIISRHLEKEYHHVVTVYDDPRPQREKEEFDILFEKERFKKECLKIFDDLNSEVLVTKELYKREDRKNSHFNHSLLRFFSCHWGKDEVNRSDVDKWFIDNNECFEHYLMGKICSKLPRWNTKQKLPDFTEAQLLEIRRYFDTNILSTSFSITINDIKSYSYTYSTISPLLIMLLQNFNFECPDEKLIEMLGNPNADFEFVTNKIKDKNILRSAILNNLENYQNFFCEDIQQFCKYTIDKNFSEAYHSILNILQDRDFEYYSKKEIISYCIDKNQLVSEIITITNTFTQKQNLSLCEQLLRSQPLYKEQAREILAWIASQPESRETRLSAISLLVSMKDNDGLKQLIDYCKENSVIALSDPFNNISVGANVSDNYLLYDDMEVLPLLIEFLELSFQLKTRMDSRNSGKIEQNLIHLALLSEDNFVEITLILGRFIQDNKEKYMDVESLYFTINQIEKLRKEKLSKSYSFKEAINICKELIY